MEEKSRIEIETEELFNQWLKKEFKLSDLEIDQIDNFFDHCESQELNEFIDLIVVAKELSDKQKAVISYILGNCSKEEMKEKERGSEVLDTKCVECGEKAEFFHSKCHGAHFEGIITPEGEFQVVCEKCGKYVGTLEMSKK